MPVRLLKLNRIDDESGWSSETYNRSRLSGLGVEVQFAQDNHSLSRPVGVLRGLHFQAPPHGQAKLVRCLRGKIWDVAVDIRGGSPTYGQWVGTELSSDNGSQLFVPVGFAHGFVTLEPNTEVVYKASTFYNRDSEGGLAWDDPTLNLPWPLPPEGPIISDKDRLLPRLTEFRTPFEYDGIPLGPLEE